ncbi:MAG: hypothetical protein Q7R67_01160 [bacterium]|nr:hypothetical protein [bacterium]
MVQVTLGRRLTPEAIGTKRTIVTRAITCREGRMLKTTISLTPDVAVMLRDALNEVLSEAGIYEVLESEIALAT